MRDSRNDLRRLTRQAIAPVLHHRLAHLHRQNPHLRFAVYIEDLAERAFDNPHRVRQLVQPRAQNCGIDGTRFVCRISR